MKMDEQIKKFLSDLKLSLEGLPEAEADEALNYYEEYFNDALDEGKSAEELLTHLDSPEKIAATIKAEASIKKAQISPGLKNYSRVLRYARTGVTKPFSLLMFSIFIIITYSIAILLFCSSIVSALAALILFPGSIYEAANIPSIYTAEIIGTLSSGAFSAILCVLLAYGLYRLCSIFIKASSGLVGRMLKKPRKQTPENSGLPVESKKSPKLFLRISLIAAAASLAISMASGLPIKLFRIFNSDKPGSIEIQKWELDQGDIGRISIHTIHSHIRLEKGSSEKIQISYEQPDWLEPEISSRDGQLIFTEKSNGRLPLFSLVSLHENRTDLVIALPSGFDLNELELESRGGYVHMDSVDHSAHVKTYTGNIYIDTGSGSNVDSDQGNNISSDGSSGSNTSSGGGSTSTKGSTEIRASTSTGTIRQNGKDVGIKASNGTEYKVPGQSPVDIKLETSMGSIYIE